MIRLAAFLLALLALPAAAGAAAAEFPEIAEAKSALTRAAADLEAAKSGPARLAALSKAATAHEVALAAYRAGLRRMASAEATVRQSIEADRVRLETLMAALQSLGQAPRSALLAFPGGPVGAARGASLMAEISPVLQHRLAEFRTRLGRLNQLRAIQDAARIEAKGTLAALQGLRTATADAVRRNRRRNLAPRAELKTQAELAARQAKNIEALAAALSKSALGGASPLVTFTEARGLINLPVSGRVTAGFGDDDPWGRPGRGLTITAPAYAQVSAPWDGTVRFAGPLIDYHEVVVLEPEAGTMIVLAGLRRVDRLVGEIVLAGERLGDLGGPIPASDEFLLEATTDRGEIGEETLYIELRRNGEAVDPAPWFDLTKKGNGG